MQNPSMEDPSSRVPGRVRSESELGEKSFGIRCKNFVFRIISLSAWDIKQVKDISDRRNSRLSMTSSPLRRFKKA
jgi:hypothetical protein